MISDLTNYPMPFPDFSALGKLIVGVHWLRPFTPFDFQTFASVESKEPLIGMIELPDDEGFTVIVDNCTIHVLDMDDNEWVGEAPSCAFAKAIATEILNRLSLGEEAEAVSNSYFFTLV